MILRNFAVSNENKNIFGKEALVQLLITTLKIFSIILLYGIFCWLTSHMAFATDRLAGTDVDFKDTAKGTGLFYLLGIEVIAGIILCIQQRSPKPFLGVVIVLLGSAIGFKIAGF